MSTWYGSLHNRLAERMVSPEPFVGMFATELMWSDRHAYEVIAVKDSRHVTVRALKATMVPGTDWLDQEYELSSDENGSVAQLFKKKNGQWVQRYSDRSYGNRFALGFASEYEDPSF